MRISDWSSDVCSSDLVQFQTVLAHQLGDAVRDEDIILAQHVRDRRGADLKFRQGVEINLVDRPAGGENVDDGGHANASAISRRVLAIPNSEMKLPKVGRASCRERVCQYV